MSQTHNENSRVNRIYKSYRYGYVVDFADIEREFDKTNRAYWDELSNELGDEIGSYSQLFKTAEEIEQEIADIKNALFDFDTENAEEFCSQISQIEDKKTASSPKKSPANPARRRLRHPHPVGTMKQGQPVSDDLAAFKWMIEELRVSLFAQELKTPYPVSVKRLMKELI